MPGHYVKTLSGFGTVPEAFVLNFKEKVWYIVEVELADHGVWSYIIPQATRQLVAVKKPEMRRKLIDMLTEEIEKTDELKKKFIELDVSEIDIRKIIEDIIGDPPILAILIDYVSADLKDWASVLENEVRLLEIEKYIDEETGEVIYRIPEYIPPPTKEEDEKGKKKAITREEFIAQCEEPAKYLFEELEKSLLRRNILAD